AVAAVGIGVARPRYARVDAIEGVRRGWITDVFEEPAGTDLPAAIVVGAAHLVRALEVRSSSFTRRGLAPAYAIDAARTIVVGRTLTGWATVGGRCNAPSRGRASASPGALSSLGVPLSSVSTSCDTSLCEASTDSRAAEDGAHAAPNAGPRMLGART